MLKKTISWILLLLLLASMLMLARYSQPVSARTITVPDEFSTIQEAINNATNGDTVFVRSGTYYEKVVVNKAIMLIGEDMKTTIIRYNASVDDNIVEVTASYAAVKNFTIINDGAQIYATGILVKDAYYCSITENNLTERNYIGIAINNASSCYLVGNVFTNNGMTVHLSYGNMIMNNTLNGKLIITMEDAENEILDAGGAGQVILMHCNNVTVRYGSFSNTAIGVQVRESNSCKVINNSFKDSYEGISLGRRCFNTVVSGNNVTNCFGYGIVALGNTAYSIVSENTISGNDCGITFSGSSDNKISHNTFMNNSDHVETSSSVNTWDNGYPSGGNYWSDYSGTDIYRGADQTDPGSDGIGDTDYVIDESNLDHYPLMGPFGPLTTTGSNVTVFPSPDVGLTYQNVTVAGSTTAHTTETGPPLPPNSTLVGYYDITTTAKYVGKISVRITYNDSNMTQEEENSLRLLQWSGCDVTGPTSGVPDGIINMRDIGYFCSNFLKTPSIPDWDPRCDVTGPTPGVPDGVVNMRDIGEACSSFMGTNQWTDITTYIDTVNNVIYGETTHFSMFGVTRE